MKTALALLVLAAACGGKEPAPQPAPGKPGGAQTCIKTGCSGTVCAAEETVSTCEYKPEYSCYKVASCEWQASGGCGWRQTPELAECLKNPPPDGSGSAVGTGLPAPM
ncbi:MAG TPA: hypothetical protein VGM90_05780 [Kofleriaceae bacterium]|jgi:hypothetical protein